jgi:hypothetical protein
MGLTVRSKIRRSFSPPTTAERLLGHKPLTPAILCLLPTPTVDVEDANRSPLLLPRRSALARACGAQEQRAQAREVRVLGLQEAALLRAMHSTR